MPTWTYSQRTGALIDPDGAVIGYGYAGHPPFVNRPAAEGRENEGPLPTGNYIIEAAVDHPTCGPCSLPLAPYPDNAMHGRSGFLIHGDDSTPADQSASAGCIILDRPIRDVIEASAVRELAVIV